MSVPVKNTVNSVVLFPLPLLPMTPCHCCLEQVARVRMGNIWYYFNIGCV